jgi:hypothetical protein
MQKEEINVEEHTRKTPKEKHNRTVKIKPIKELSRKE